MRVPSILTVPLDFLPMAGIEAASRLLFRRLLELHPKLFDRLGEYRSRRFAFIPTDLLLAFLVEPAGPQLAVQRKTAAIQADASVEAPVFMLLALLEGHCDADALFFSRDLTVSGDMEAMLAMRNALDDCNIDLPRDLAPLSGPISPLVMRFAREIRNRALQS